MVTQLTPKQRALAQKCVDFERKIWELYQNKPHFPCNNDDWSDAHQEYLEWQYELRDIDEQYQKAQKEFFDSICANNRKVKTAKQYYVKQKDFEDTVAYYKENHINGF
jgi:hypothetical protein